MLLKPVNSMLIVTISVTKVNIVNLLGDNTAMEYQWKTPTVTIVTYTRYDTLYDGPVENIPEFINHYRIVSVRVNKAINNTYVEVI